MLAGKQIVTMILGSDWAITASVEDGRAQGPRDPSQVASFTHVWQEADDVPWSSVYFTEDLKQSKY